MKHRSRSKLLTDGRAAAGTGLTRVGSSVPRVGWRIADTGGAAFRNFAVMPVRGRHAIRSVATDETSRSGSSRYPRGWPAITAPSGWQSRGGSNITTATSAGSEGQSETTSPVHTASETRAIPVRTGSRASTWTAPKRVEPARIRTTSLPSIPVAPAITNEGRRDSGPPGDGSCAPRNTFRNWGAVCIRAGAYRDQPRPVGRPIRLRENPLPAPRERWQTAPMR